MPALTAPITDSVVREAIVRAVESVFKTMMGRKVTLVGESSTPAPAAAERPAEILGSVGFVGDASGLIYLGLTEEFAKTLTGAILGMSAEEIEENGPEVVKDAIGEVTNMSVGGFKNTLCDLGHVCKLTLPTIVRGNQLTVAGIKAATRHIFYFDCDGQRLTADIQLKQE